MHTQIRPIALVFTILFNLVCLTANAQEHAHESPYTAIGDREIKALSNEEISGLLNGEGLGMALPAELHGFPGPRHVLDMREELNLTDSQLTRIQALFDSMHDEAVEIGSAIVAQERMLDEQFANATINAASLETAVMKAANLRGTLRATHLRAHLEMMDILDDFQKRHYNVLRGYADHEH